MMEKECCKVGGKFWMPRIEQNGDVAPSHGRKVSIPLTKGKHLTQLNDDITIFSLSKENDEDRDCQFPCKRPIQELNFDVSREAPPRM